VDTVELQQVPAFNRLLQESQLGGVIVRPKKSRTVM
jgi:hypothetical protein